MAASLLLSVLLSVAPVDAWGPVYQAAGVTRAEARVDTEAAALYARPAYAPALAGYLLADPLRVPDLAETAGRGFVRDAPRLPAVLGRAAWAAGYAVRRDLNPAVLNGFRSQVVGDRVLAVALARLRAAGGATGEPAQPDPATDDLPQALQQEVALLLIGLEDAAVWRQQAYQHVPAATLDAILGDLTRFATVQGGETGAGSESLAHERRLDRLAAGLDPSALAAGAMDLALVVEDARTKLPAIDASAITSRRYRSPWGDVVIGGPGNDRYDGPAPLLLIDFGGDDRYAFTGGPNAANRPASVLLDLAGNDTYEAPADAVGAWGASVGGMSFLVDLAGNDRYTAGDVSEGCGIGGVGVLWDGGGDDTYTGRVHTQGAGAFGLGLLVDLGGHDGFSAAQRAQGFGYTLGAGVLVDVAGDTTYTVADDPRAFPSQVTAEHGASLAQGVGFGRRADLTTGHSLAGGVGWLVDGAGADTYRAAVYAQGCGYQGGVGLLADVAGNDSYQAVSYAQGAGVSGGVGGLADLAGDDAYEVTTTSGLGLGHDFGLGFLYEAGGNDRYTAPTLSLGAGNANGVGYAWDVAGDDVYDAKPGVNLGMARLPGKAEDVAVSPRRSVPALGLFLDGGGRDRFPRPEQGNGRAWRDAQPDTGARGAGAAR